MLGRVDRSILKWSGHMERMDNIRITKIIYFTERRGIMSEGGEDLIGNEQLE